MDAIERSLLALRTGKISRRDFETARRHKIAKLAIAQDNVPLHAERLAKGVLHTGSLVSYSQLERTYAGIRYRQFRRYSMELAQSPVAIVIYGAVGRYRASDVILELCGLRRTKQPAKTDSGRGERIVRLVPRSATPAA